MFLFSSNGPYALLHTFFSASLLLGHNLYFFIAIFVYKYRCRMIALFPDVSRVNKYSY
jgi:hypothetical protein